MKLWWRNTRTRMPVPYRDLFVKIVEAKDAEKSFWACQRRGDRLWCWDYSCPIVSPFREIFWMYTDDIEEASRE